MANKEAVVS